MISFLSSLWTLSSPRALLRDGKHEPCYYRVFETQGARFLFLLENSAATLLSPGFNTYIEQGRESSGTGLGKGRMSEGGGEGKTVRENQETRALGNEQRHWIVGKPREGTKRKRGPDTRGSLATRE